MHARQINTSDNLTTQEAAALLSLSARTLETWRITGNGPRYLKLGRSVRYSRTELESFQQESMRHHTSEGR